MNRMDEIVAKVGDMKPLPGTVVKLISAINDPNSSIKDIVDAIRYDQVVTARMLRLCNSAYFGLSREVSSIDDALRLLGTLKTLQFVMAIHTSSLLSRDQKGYGLAQGVLWRHAVGVALASMHFAELTKPPNTNLAFTAGLLHDIGKVLLDEFVAEEFKEITSRVSTQGVAFDVAEREVLGFSHDEIGEKLGQKWELPEPIIECIRYHHHPEALDPPNPLVDTVYLANTVCLLLGIGLGVDGLCYRADASVLERYGLRETDLEQIGVQVTMELKKVEEAFTEGMNKHQPCQASAGQ